MSRLLPAPIRILSVAAAAWLVLPASLSGCSPVYQRAHTEFWLEASPDPVLEVDPAARLPADASELTEQGLVVNHGPSFDSPTDYTLEILSDSGETLYLHYSLGTGQRIEVERGELVRLALWQRRSEGAPLLRSLFLEAYRSTDLLHRRTPVVIVQVNSMIPKKTLPEPLRHLVPHDEVTYQTSERLKATCTRSLLRRSFASDADLAVSGDGHAPTTWPPGAKAEVHDRIDRFDVQFIDNRELLATDCPDQHRRLWAWVATYLPPSPTTLQNLKNLKMQLLPELEPVALPAPPTPTAAPSRTKLPAHKLQPLKPGLPPK